MRFCDSWLMGHPSTTLQRGASVSSCQAWERAPRTVRLDAIGSSTDESNHHGDGDSGRAVEAVAARYRDCHPVSMVQCENTVRAFIAEDLPKQYESRLPNFHGRARLYDAPTPAMHCFRHTAGQQHSESERSPPNNKRQRQRCQRRKKRRKRRSGYTSRRQCK